MHHVRRSRKAASAVVRRRQIILLAGLGLVMGLSTSLVVALLRTHSFGLSVGWLMGEPKFLDRPRSVLVIGLDRAARGARGDLFSVFRLDPRAREIFALSLPHETQTTIPGFGVGRLKDVPVVGEYQLARQTIEALLGLAIDRTVVFLPKGAQALIDTIGGVEMHVPRALTFRDPDTGEGIALEVGKRRLTGKQVVALARSRPSPTDLGRITLQQALADATIRKVMTRPWQVVQVTRGILASCTTDLKASEANEIGLFLQAKPPIVYAMLPGNPGYGNTWIPSPSRFANFLVAFDPNSQHKEKILTISSSKQPIAEILFAARHSKAATNLANSLTERGVMVLRISPLEIDEPTYIISRNVAAKVDETIRSLIPSAPWLLTDDDSPYSADYTLVLGRDTP